MIGRSDVMARNTAEFPGACTKEDSEAHNHFSALAPVVKGLYLLRWRAKTGNRWISWKEKRARIEGRRLIG